MTRYPARFYAAVHDGNPGDAAFYRRRCLGVGSIVELGCGDARVLAALAEPGRTLVGVDIDEDLLELAAARARSCGASLELIAADMRAEDLADRLGGRRFDRVIIPHGGIYCLLDEHALEQALERATALLDDGGLLLLDAWAADDFHVVAEPEDQDPSWLERVKTIEVDGELYEVLERSTWDKPNQRLDVTYIHVRVGGEDAIEGLLEQRYVLADELCALLDRVGLDLVELAGDFEGGPYDERSELMVVTARLRRSSDRNVDQGSISRRPSTGGSAGVKINQPAEREASPHAGRRPSTGGSAGVKINPSPLAHRLKPAQTR